MKDVANKRGPVLLVEPNPAARIVARNQLASRGFDVIGVSGVREASAVVAVREMCAAVVDLDCALAHGLDAHRVSDFLRATPVLFSGARRSQESAPPSPTRSRAADVPVIEKPFLPHVLVRAIEATLMSHQAGSSCSGLRASVSTFASASRYGSVSSDGSATNSALVSNHALASSYASVSNHALASSYASVSTDASASHRERPHQQAEFSDLASAVQADLALQGLTLDPAARCALSRVWHKWSAETSRSHLAPDSGRLVVDGDLARVSLDQVFQLAMGVGGQAGCLLAHGDAAVEVYFREGDVVFARQRNLPDGFTLGRILVASGCVTDHAVEALASRLDGGAWIGQRLLRHGLICDQDLLVALSRQTEELVFEAARWPGGRFSIFADVELPREAQSAGVCVSAHLLLLEGMRRLDDWARMAGDVGDLGSVVCRAAASEEGQASSTLMPEDRWVLERMDGDSTVMELVRRLQRPTYHVFRTLHRLVSRRLVDVRPVSA